MITMEKITPTIGVWLYLVIATLAETLVFYRSPGNYSTEIAIGLIAAVSAIVTALISMNLKDESAAVQYILLVPVLLVAVLIVTMVLAYPVNF
jgi:cytochrome c oxidase subunit IV